MLAHWEEYHTGQMIYGNGAWGVTEANYALVATHLVTVLAGPRLWELPLPQVVTSLLADLTGNPDAKVIDFSLLFTLLLEKNMEERSGPRRAAPVGVVTVLLADHTRGTRTPRYF
jgi:hypothetical protein